MVLGNVKQRQRIDLLDAYRMIAIAWVAVFHFGYYWSTVGPGYNILPYDAALAWIPLASVGVLGVSLFFMISGYVISITLKSTPNLQTFLVKRFARLWPTLIVCGALTFTVVNLMGPPELKRSIPEALISMLLIPPQHVGLITGHEGWQWLDGAYWSLWVEVKFYLVIGVLYFLFPKRWFEAWLVFALIAFAASIANVLVSSAVVDMADGLLFGVHVPFFTFGMAASRYKAGEAGVLDAYAAGSMLMIILFNLFSPNTTEPVTLSLIIGHLIVIGLFAGFVWRPEKLAWMEHKLVLRIGRASYSFYLLHQVVGISLLVAIAAVAGWVVSLIALPFIIAALLYVSTLIFDHIEQPANRWIVKAYRNRYQRREAEETISTEEERRIMRYVRRFD